MRSILAGIFMSFFLTTTAQKNDTISYYIDGLEKRVEQKVATYLRVGFKADTLWQVYDFYLTDDKIRMKALSKDDSFKVKHGPCEYYFKSGKLLGKGTFLNGKKVGLWRWFFESGATQDSTVFINGMPAGNSIGFYKNGLIAYKSILDTKGAGNGNGVHYYESGTVRDSGNYQSDKRSGVWYFYREDQSKASEVIFEQDSAVSAKNFDASGKVTSTTIIEQEAAYPGGDNAWIKYLTDKISAVYKKKNYADFIGSCNIQFIVDKDGSINSIEVIEGMNQTLAAYVTEFLMNSKKWNAAIQFNLPVKAYRRQRFTIYPPQD